MTFNFLTFCSNTRPLAVPDTQTSFCVLKNPANLGPELSEVKMICLILSPTKSKQTKSGIEVGRTYTTLLSDLELRRRLIASTTPAEFATIVKEGCCLVKVSSGVI